MLDCLDESSAELGPVQRSQSGGIGKHGNGRVEGADQILSVPGVHAGLAAYRSIDHREQ